MNASVRIVLVKPRDPNNIGAVARAMKNFGFRDLWVVAPYSTTWEEVTAAPHAMDVLSRARIVTTLDEAIADCNLIVGTGDPTRASAEVATLTPCDLSERLKRERCQVALVFGNEKHGLTNEDLCRCHHLMSIPTLPDCPSMNLGQSVAVCLYELIRAKPPGALPAANLAEGRTLHIAAQLSMEVLQLTDFVLPGNRDDLEQRVRAALGKYQLTQYDAAMLCGILRKIKDKISQE